MRGLCLQASMTIMLMLEFVKSISPTKALTTLSTSGNDEKVSSYVTKDKNKLFMQEVMQLMQDPVQFLSSVK